MARIGIKLADGSFFPVLEDNQPARKRLVLSLARTGQTSAQIDIIRRDESLEQSIGCLVLQDLPDGGAADLEFVLGLDAEGTIDARVSDPTGEQYQSVAVSLSTLSNLESYSLPDTAEDEPLTDIGGVDSLEDISLPDLEDEVDFDATPFSGAATQDAASDHGDDDLSSFDLDDAFNSDIEEEGMLGDVATAVPGMDGDAEYFDEMADEDMVDEDEDEASVPPRSFSPLLLISLILVVLSLAALGAYGVFRWLQSEPVPAIRASLFLIAPAFRSHRIRSRGTQRRHRGLRV